MRERVEALVGRRARAMWVMTFHSACARMLRADAERLGYTRGFTIYDEQDSLRLVKNCIEELDIDPKRFAPRGIRARSPTRRTSCSTPRPTGSRSGSFFEQTAADVYDLYEPRLHAANAMDFDDLLFRCVNLFELFAEVRDRYRRSFRHVLVDEYQDTNRAQYRWLQLLARGAPQPRGGRRRRPVDLRASAAPTSATSSDFERDFPDAARHQARAELPLDADDPDRGQRASSRTTARARRRRSGPSSARATPFTCASSRTSTPRRASWCPRSSGSWTRAARATTSPSSTAPTRRAACSRTCSCATASPTR